MHIDEYSSGEVAKRPSMAQLWVTHNECGSPEDRAAYSAALDEYGHTRNFTRRSSELAALGGLAASLDYDPSP